jgi:hypothetical protein
MVLPRNLRAGGICPSRIMVSKVMGLTPTYAAASSRDNPRGGRFGGSAEWRCRGAVMSDLVCRVGWGWRRWPSDELRMLQSLQGVIDAAGDDGAGEGVEDDGNG